MKGVDRVCEMGASPDDVGFDGCTLPWKYTVPVYPGVKAVVNPPFAGVHVKDWEPATGPNTTPQHGRGGLPYIPFFYAQKSSESLADEEEAAYQKVYATEQKRIKKAETELVKAIAASEKTKALRDSNHRKFSSEELAPLIAKGLNVVGGGK